MVSHVSSVPENAFKTSAPGIPVPDIKRAPQPWAMGVAASDARDGLVPSDRCVFMTRDGCAVQPSLVRRRKVGKATEFHVRFVIWVKGVKDNVKVRQRHRIFVMYREGEVDEIMKRPH